jgi:hypothetical protein
VKRASETPGDMTEGGRIDGGGAAVHGRRGAIDVEQGKLQAWEETLMVDAPRQDRESRQR